MRRYEIDWIRNISILMLFVYHTCAIFCNFGDFYVISQEKNVFADIFILLLFTWYMPLLFFLAGASTYFSFQRRSLKEYIIERVKKLLIPLLFGLLVLVPPQTYLARLWRGEINLKYIEHMKYFFSNITDFTGFDGAFTPAHLWFILYLFIVSIIGGSFIFILFKKEKGTNLLNQIKYVFCRKYSFISLLILGVVADIFPSIMGKSILSCLIIYTFGYVIYHDDMIFSKLVRHRYKYLLCFVFFTTLGTIYTLFLRPDQINIYVWIIDSILKNSVLICAISSVIGFSSIHLNTNNKVLKYLNKSAFPVYLIHQPILLILAYIIIPTTSSTTISMIMIIVISFVTTFVIYELLNKFKIFSFFLGMK